MRKVKKERVDSYRTQVAQSMAELNSIMATGRSVSGDGRFTVRTIRVAEPGVYRPAAVRAIRRRLGMSQAVFAQLLGVSQVLVRSWERGARAPAAIACRLLDVIRDHPEMLKALIHSVDPTPARPIGTATAKHNTPPRRRRASAAA